MDLPELRDNGFSARILADSLSPSGAKLTSMELTFPRLILSEFNTHRMLSKNSASSRAIPVATQLRKILETPFVPLSFGVNEAGMQASAFLTGEELQEARAAWLRGRDRAIWSALEMLIGVKELTLAFGEGYWKEFESFANYEQTLRVLALLQEYQNYISECRVKGHAQTRFLNVHKQTANRVLEPYAWHKVIVTATEWDNFWALRDSPMAQPEMETIAKLARAVYNASNPRALEYGDWHLPLLTPAELKEAKVNPELWLKVAVGRAARVSAETHDRKGRDIQADVNLHDRLLNEGHMSPFEHIARPLALDSTFAKRESWSGNFRGFEQLRKTLPNEDDFSKALKSIKA